MKNTFMRLFVFLGFMCYACPIFGGESLKIGIVDSLSGPPSLCALDSLDAFKLVVEKVNAKGGVLGKKIEYFTRDDKFKPDVALSMAKELVLRQNVDILAGTMLTPAALAISDFARQEKIPYIIENAKSYKILGERGHRYVFSVDVNTTMIGQSAAVVLSKKPFIRYWIAGEDYEYSHNIGDITWDNLKRLKPDVQLLGQTWWKLGETDFLPYIAQIIAAKTDFAIICSSGGGLTDFQKAASATGFNKKVPFYQHNAIDPPVVRPQGLDGPEGVYGTVAYVHYLDYPQNKKFVQEFKNAYGREPSVCALNGYNAAQFIVNGFEKAQKIDKEALIDALEGLILDSPVGKIELRTCDHQVLLPMFWGVTKMDPKLKHLIATDIIRLNPKEYAPTCEEVLKMR